MITIWHFGPAFFERQVFDETDSYPGIRAWRYAIGLTPPNYPVPAIRYEVDYIQDNGETFVTVLWYMSNPQLPVCLEYWH